MVWAEDLAGHAVRAAQVAAVGDGDAEISEVSAEEVCWGGVHVHNAMLTAVFRKI